MQYWNKDREKPPFTDHDSDAGRPSSNIRVFMGDSKTCLDDIGPLEASLSKGMKDGSDANGTHEIIAPQAWG